MTTPEETRIAAQAGPQELFLACDATICIYGGSAFGGKTFGQLLDPLRYVHDPAFGGVLFRRTTPQIKNEGGLWDESEKLYPLLGAKGFRQQLEWRFPSGAKIKMAHLEKEKNKFDWQGARLPYIGFEEGTQFTEGQFWFLVGRCAGGAPAQIRMTCNPDPDSFVARLVEWWIDPQTGYAIKERSGVVRWLVRIDDRLEFADTRQELIAKFGPLIKPISITFILSTIFDNKIGLDKNPDYLAKLQALSRVDRLRLLGEGDKGGNWLVRASAGMYFKRDYFGAFVDAPPANVVSRVRHWDRAATEKTADNDPDATASLRLSRDATGIFYIEDFTKDYVSAHRAKQMIVTLANQDGTRTKVSFQQDPGSAGKGEAQDMARALAGFIVRYAPATGDKETRVKPVSSQCEAGNVKIVRGRWNESFIRALENFPDAKHDEEADVLAGAFENIVDSREVRIGKLSGI